MTLPQLQTFSDVGSRDEGWWPDLTWPGAKILRQGVEKMNEQLYQARRRCAPPFLRYLQKNWGGGGREINPPGCARVNPRPYSVFCHLRPCRGGGGVGATPPPGDRPLMVVEIRGKKTVDEPRRDLAIAHIVFGPRLIFDLVRSGQRSNFRENWHFLLYTLIAA